MLGIYITFLALAVGQAYESISHESDLFLIQPRPFMSFHALMVATVNSLNIKILRILGRCIVKPYNTELGCTTFTIKWIFYAIEVFLEWS